MQTLFILLTGIIYIIELIVVAGFVVIVLIGIDGALQYYKNWRDEKAAQIAEDILAEQEEYRASQEEAAYQGLYEEDYAGRLVLTQEGRDFYREMDRLRDEQIFINTEEF